MTPDMLKGIAAVVASVAGLLGALYAVITRPILVALKAEATSIRAEITTLRADIERRIIMK